MLMLGTVAIISNKNKYIEPQAAILHLQKGIYPISGYYLADGTNSEQNLINIKRIDGKAIETSEYLFH